MFKTIPDHPNYEINEKGEVKRKGKEGIRRPYPVNGHPKIILDNKTEYISRLVAEAFLENPEGKSDVNHIDRNTMNDHVSNLEWATHGEIQKESYRGSRAPGGRMYAKQVMIVETGEIFPSIRACSRAIFGTPSGIRRCLENEKNTYKGFHYKLML